MRTFLKFIGGLVLIVAILGLLGMISREVFIPVITPWLTRLSFNFSWPLSQFFLIVLIAMLILCALLLILLISIPARKQRLVIKQNTGDIVIPKKSIESIVRNACYPVIDPDKLKTNIKIGSGNKIIAKIGLTVRDRKRYEAIAKDIQVRVENALKNTIETGTKDVRVYLHEADVTKTDVFGKKRREVL